MLSARLDGEDTPDERTAAEEHLTVCTGCRAWYAQAAQVTRMVRVGSMTVVPPAADDLAVPPARGRFFARPAVATALRVGLGVLGLAQFTLGMAQVAGLPAVGHQHVAGVSTGHLWHESAAWNVAIGAGFVWIAARRTRTAGVLPILTAFVALLALLSVDDFGAGRVDLLRLLSHGFVLAGYLIMVVLSRPAVGPDRPPAEGDRPGEPATGAAGGRRDVAPRPRLRLINGEATTRRAA
jgi:predicted anti-sigma-YlaC factor YlaD